MSVMPLELFETSNQCTVVRNESCFVLFLSSGSLVVEFDLSHLYKACTLVGAHNLTRFFPPNLVALQPDLAQQSQSWLYSQRYGTLGEVVIVRDRLIFSVDLR